MSNFEIISRDKLKQEQAYVPPTKELPIIVAKVNKFFPETGRALIRIQWTEELSKAFPNQELGFNPYSKKLNTHVGLNAIFTTEPNPNEKFIAVNLEFSKMTEWGAEFTAKQVYPPALSSFDEHGNVILNEEYNKFENLAKFISSVANVNGVKEKGILKVLMAWQQSLQETEYKTIETLTKMIKDNPEQFIQTTLNLVGGKKLNEEAITTIAEQWRTNLHRQNIQQELLQMGFSFSESNQLIDVMGNTVIERLSKNPYESIAIKRIGWQKADEIGKKLGIPPTDKKRIISGIEAFYRSQTMTSGDTLLHAAEFAKEMVSRFKLTPEQAPLVYQYMKEAFESGEHYRLYPFIDSKTNAPVNYFTNRDDFANEYYLAKRLVMLNKEGYQIDASRLSLCKPIIEAEEVLKNGRKVKLDPSQTKAIETCLSAPVSVLTGGAGMGKTTILKRLIMCAMRLNMKVLLCSPTGKAAKRMTESVNIQNIKAETIHTTLGFKEKSDDAKVKSGQSGMGSIFKYNEELPLPADWIFVDESSMTDVYLAKSLVSAIRMGARVTFIGDPNQLPSVQKGCFYFDLIESGYFATAKLTKTHRQADGNDIIDVAYAILNRDVKGLKLHHRKNVYYRNYDALKEAMVGGDYDQKKVNQQIVVDLVNDYAKLVKEFGIENVQVLLPKRKDTSILSTEYLNLRLRERVMRTSEDAFQVGERVIGVKNNPIFRNGEVGTIMYIGDKMLSILFDGETEPRNCYEHKDKLTFAYAITVHKSQGSEYKHVLIVMSDSDQFMLDCNWFYTAITRGKEMVYILGQEKAIRSATLKQSTRRLTTLRYLLKGLKAVKPSQLNQVNRQHYI